MSLRITPPLESIPRSQNSVSSLLPADELQYVRDVASGRATNFSRSRALNLLLENDFPDKHLDFAAVLARESEPARLRSVAAEMLGKIGSTAARTILRQALSIQDPSILLPVISGLGYTGDSDDLEALRRLRPELSGQLAAARARFARALITHRLGLDGDDLAPSVPAELLSLAQETARPIRIDAADAPEAASVLRHLQQRPLGIEYDARSVHIIRCGRDATHLALNREFTESGKLEVLASRKAVLGVWAGRNESTGVDFASAVMFSRPTQERAVLEILVHRKSGERLHAGRGVLADGEIRFSLGAVARPGGSALSLTGVLRGGRVVLSSGLGSPSVVERRRPARLGT